jgi:hypothetical protein
MLQWRDRTQSNFSIPWLIDHQHTNWHPATNQKIKPASALTAEFVENFRVSNVSLENGGKDLKVEWQNDNLPPITFSLKALKAHTTSNSRYGLPERKPWKRLAEFPQSTFADPEEVSHQKILHDLAVYGVHLITNMPDTVNKTEAFVRSRLGPPRETFYGGMWDTAPRKENINDTAYTYDALDPHTDTCYLMDSPGLQCFNCVAQDSGSGGQTRLVDAAMVLTILKCDSPATFQFFAETPLVFHHTEKGLHARVCTPVINLEDDGSLKQFRYNEYDLAPLNYLPEKKIDELYFHNEILHRTIKGCEFPIKLKVGDMVVLDNHRVMHGRTAFKGYRNLIGCYVGADDWIMRARAVAVEGNNAASNLNHDLSDSESADWQQI